jgi:hypothetical protein
LRRRTSGKNGRPKAGSIEWREFLDGRLLFHHILRIAISKNIMKSLPLLLLMIFMAGMECSAQDKTIDSLRSLLSTSKADTSTIKVLAYISYYYRLKQPDTGWLMENAPCSWRKK